MKSHRASIIIVGTGVGGLAAAKTYLELDPEADILLLEKRSGLGGVWAEENCYDGLKTNNLRGTYEFTDFPLDDSYGVKDGEHIPGLVLYRYMTDFAVKFDVFRRIRFNVNIHMIEKLDKGGWELVGEDNTAAEKPVPVSYRCEKLIMCTGLASTPNPVSYPGREAFGKPVLNHGQLKVEAHEVASDPNVMSVTIVGASKTGYDAVQLMASRGKKVTWVIRESGGGGVWMSPPWVKMGPFTLQLEHVATMRFFTWFSPCVWGEYDGYSWVRRFLHGTWLGRTMVHRLWEKIRMDTVNFNGYRKNESISQLEPYESLFWSARVGVLNYPGNIHDYVTSGQVQIIKKDISHLSKNGTINFADDTTSQTDALIAITGWKLSPNIQYKPDGIEASLGIPTENMSSEEQDFWTHLDKDAEHEILQKFPYLTRPPKNVIPYKQKVSPYRLYRGMAPPGLTSRSDNSIVFIKMVHSTANIIIAETQALWAYAYLNNKIQINKDRVYKETALSSCYGRLRYPCGFSAWYPEFVYDTVPFYCCITRIVSAYCNEWSTVKRACISNQGSRRNVVGGSWPGFKAENKLETTESVARRNDLLYSATDDMTVGTGATVYILDSGIRSTHKKFGGRAVWGANFVSGSPDRDEFGNGTHVAGIVGGKTYGVAKGCSMYAVKVIDKNGMNTMSNVLQGLQWAVNHAKSKGITKKSIINASLGGPYTKIGNDAVKAATDLGITIVVAAGNEAEDAANYSPASAPSAITVGAIDSSNYRTLWSNYGKVVDIFAPGSDILSAGHLSDSGSVYRSGTNMAAPHVAGLAAYFMAKEGLRGSVAVTKRIIGAAYTTFVGEAFDGPQHVAYNGGGK
ncbi:dimethylaniline monooxygenase [Fusarium tjaetaba]|uniref:Dimethylaniline monooxygenase n=1 Tax=Fusarium tjaetaba TaxID=1567544 RepID=A0A8H5RMP0_9HYPO|nr:dimethylaniline monooxygenase [Fusarium tjaetaba]KAF5637631.1 dimethylaniline monooxygenase [Fusarium tjaetaba]